MIPQNSENLELDFTSLEFFPNFVVSTIKEDTVFEEKHVLQLIEICNSYYRQQPFAYVANRKFSYNVNPLIYSKLWEIPNLKGIAIHSERTTSLRTANFEKHFSPVPLELFNNLEEAKIWSEGLVSGSKQGE